MAMAETAEPPQTSEAPKADMQAPVLYYRRHRVQITHFFRGQIGSWRPLGVGLVVSSRLHRLRRSWGPPRACQAIHGFVGRIDERIGRNMLEAAAYAV